MSNRFCMYCGTPLSPKDSFCSHCGKPVPKAEAKFCHQCGAPLEPKDRFCMKCGAVIGQEKPAPRPQPPRPKSPVIGQCRRCGTELTVGMRKCPKCGKKYKRKLTKGQITRRVIAAVLVGAILGVTLWNRQLMPWDLLKKKHKSVELEAGQTVQPGMTVSYADTKGETARGMDSARNTIVGTLGIRAENLGNGEKTEALGDSFYRFEQTYNGIPVYGREAILAAEGSGETIGVYGNYMELSSVNTTPAVSDEEARKTLKRKFGDILVLSSHLTIYTLRDHEPELAWQYRVMGEKFSGECLVSAVTGKLLFSNASERTLTVVGEGKDNREINRKFNTEFDDRLGYCLEDTVHKFVIYNADGENHARRYYVHNGHGNFYIDRVDENLNVFRTDGTKVTNEEVGDALNLDRYVIHKNGVVLKPVASTSTRWTDKNAVSLMHGLMISYEFYNKYFYIKGFDKRGGTVVAVYNDNLYNDPGNAYSADDLNADGIAILAFGKNNTISTDLVAHEYTHSLENVAVGMKYQGETGAIMEAYSDIFGELIEDYDIDLTLNGDCDWAHEERDHKTPGLHGYPSIYKGINWKSTKEGADDHGHVHNNSTVISHAAYNMVRTDNFFTDPLTTEQLAEQFYYLLHALPKDCTMKQFAEEMMYFAKMDNEAGVLNDSQLLTMHLALVRAGLLEMDLSLFPEFDFIRVIAHEMAMFVPQILIDETGISREELEEGYYQELSVFWIQLNDPEVHEAFRELWRYVVHGEPLN